MFNLIRTDCYWHHCEHDMGASIDCCSLIGKLGECPCSIDCKNFVSNKEVTNRLTPKPPVWKDRKVLVAEDYEDGTGAINEHNWSDWVCPSCGEVVGKRFSYPGLKPHDQHKCNYCPTCGQAIDWSGIKQ